MNIKPRHGIYTQMQMRVNEEGFHWTIIVILSNLGISGNCYSGFCFSFTGLEKTIKAENACALYLKKR
jgi:O-antigen ligase